MSRKDYVAIAEAFKAELANIKQSRDMDIMPTDSYRQVSATIRSLANGIADALRADNSRFDRERFLVACGL